MKNLISLLSIIAAFSTFIFLNSCGGDDGTPAEPTGIQVVYELNSIGNSGVSGTVTFAELDDSSTKITISLNGTTGSASLPAHIHDNTAVETGGIAIDLTSIDATTGDSETTVTKTNAGNTITYAQLIEFDGYVNIHKSADDLGTLMAQGDIGQNALTGDFEVYPIESVSDPAISGEATFSKRNNSETLVVIELDGDAEDSNHPAHIHHNTAAEGGDVAIALTSITGGISKTNVAANSDGMSVSYEDLIDFDGHINVHLSPDVTEILVGQGDVGQNKLTGQSEVYSILSVTSSNISGEATFAERINGEILVEIELEGDPSDSNHPTHIHLNTALEGGGIIIDLSNVQAGKSKTNVSVKNDDTIITYDELIEFDGHINVHISVADFSFVAQGDIGQNALTGESVTYPLNPKSNPNISGTAKFEERVSGVTLITIQLVGTSAGASHPTHIHNNDAATGGGITIDLTNVDGSTGSSKTNVNQLNDGMPIDYDGLIIFNGYINVHNSEADFSTLVAQGNIGSNG